MGTSDIDTPNLNQFFAGGIVHVRDIRSYGRDVVIDMLCSAYGINKDVLLERFSELNKRNACIMVNNPINKVIRAYAFIMECNLPSIPESEYHKSIQ